MPGRKTMFDNHLFAEEPTTAFRSNVGITARLFGTCCLGAPAASTKSPIGSKPRVAGGWEDCPAFDLDPVGSRQGSAASVDAAISGRGPKPADGNRSPYYLVPRHGLPLGEAEQMPLGDDSRPHSPARISSVNALSSPQIPVASVLAAPPGSGACKSTSGGGTPQGGSPRDIPDAGPCTPPLSGPQMTSLAIDATQDGGAAATATDMYNSDNESLPAAESPLVHSQTVPRDSRQHLQHRVALRLLERRGVLPDGGSGGASSARTSASGNSPGGGSPGSLSGSGAADAGCPSPPTMQQMSVRQQQQSLPPSGALGVAPGTGLVIMSPNSARGSPTTDYYSAVSSPVVTSPDGGGAATPSAIPVETAVEVDERLCLQEEETEDPLDIRGTGYRMSAPGLGVRAVMKGRAAWAWDGGDGGSPAGAPGGGDDDDACGPGGTAGILTADAGDGSEPPVRMRGSDFGGVVGGPLPAGVFVRARARAAAAGVNGDTPRSAVVPCAGVDDEDMYRGGKPHGLGNPPSPVWSAAGGRMELSQEEKEWLFGQPGGIGGLAPVMALGEGGEGLVDLVRLDLPTRTLHLARKATRTCLPAFALSAAGTGPAAAAAAVLGVRAQNISYRFPFEFFDREVKAMKAVKDSGFVIRFQAAAYDHEAGQGFILMEAAPYGTLEDLHAALCRSQLQPAQRQRPALLQRAFAKLNFAQAKSSAPPSLIGGPSGSNAPVGGAGSGGGLRLFGGGTTPHSPAGGVTDRPSLPRPPAGGGIGSCGGAKLGMGNGGGASGAGAVDQARVSGCCSTPSAMGSDELNMTTPATVVAVGDPGGRGGGSSAQFAALGSSLMSTRALKYYGACMLQALVALHEAGYVYRDLKLSNILICDGGRVRLTDFGAATPSLPDQPGFYGGAAGTRAYLAPEVLPWLEAGAKGGKRSSGSGGGGGLSAEPYTITVDSWTWGLVMVELATGWSLKELTQRVIRRVCGPRGPDLPDLPPDCGLPPLLRQLLLDHVLVRDPRERWTADRIRTHRFFEGVDWETLPEAEGPHAHLFMRGRMANVPPPPVLDSPTVVAEAMLEAEAAAAGGRRGSRPSGVASSLRGGTVQWGAGLDRTGSGVSGAGDGEGYGTEGGASGANAVLPFANRLSGLSSGRPSYAGGGAGGPPSPLPRSPGGPISPGSVLVSPASAGSGRSTGQGYVGSGLLAGGNSGAGAASGVRQSSPGGGLLIGPVVVSPGALAPSPPVSGSILAAGGVGGGSRRHTVQGTVGTSRLSGSHSFRRHMPGNPPPAVALPPSMPPQQVVAAE